MEQNQNRLITGFVVLSLLLHLLLLLIPKDRLMPSPPAPEPVYVEVRPPQQPETRKRELDIPIRKELEKPRTKPAKRLAEKNQVVVKETAPQGQDTEDSQRSVVQKAQPRPQQQPPAPAAQSRQPQQSVQPADEAPPQRKLPVTADGTFAPPKPKETVPQKPKRDISLKDLLTVSPQTMASIDRDWRRKYREDVDKGDTVWLDTEQDLLSSFMRRFRNNVYLVWDYPSSAAERGQEGTCLLRITVTRAGDVTSVQLLESSGYPSLDEEAIDAVRKGATYGPLPRAYPHDDLKIMAFFKYTLGTRVIRRDMY